jgi:very-short-patch-repair endonuclease/DNA polymerase III delta prime subunit
MNSAPKDNTILKAVDKLRMRLLDLTSRNRLINFRHTKNGSLRIIDELPDQLVETLLAETEMRFLPVPEPTRDQLIEEGYIKIDEDTGQEVRLLKDPTAEEWAKRLQLSTNYEVPKPPTAKREDKHTDTAIQTLLYPYELEARLKKLLQTAESGIQEMGANILYLAFGFLEWFDDSSDNARIAPLFLVPVRLHKGRLNQKTKTYEYTLSYSGEDILPNLSLREKLRADFAMKLPDLDENTTPEAYFDFVGELIQKNQPRWRVRRFITIALLNFSKLLMYLDLDPSRWPEGASIIDHPVVTQILSGDNANEDNDKGIPGDLGFGEEFLIDEMDDIHANYPLIDDADTSQHSALIDAIDGKNLVIEGPPGTGKSQTITNLIAAAMAKGKRVLFVAEKLAALEVVRRRLDAVGLGEFCLELHSHKSQKRKILDEVEERLKKHGNYRKPRDIEVDIARYEELKTVLKKHVEVINRPWKKTGKTLHEILMVATRYREVVGINPDALHPEGYDGGNFDVSTQRRTKDQVEAFRKIYQVVAGQLDGNTSMQQHPWNGVRNADLQIFDLDLVKEALQEWQKALKNLNGERAKIAEGLDSELDKITTSLTEISLILADLERLPILKGDELLDRLPLLRGEVLDKTQQYLELFEYIQKLYAALAKKVGSEILQDLSVVDDFLRGSDQLRQLVGQGVQLGTLTKAIHQLRAMHGPLDTMDKILRKIQAAVGDDAAKHLLLTEAGLNEFKNFVDLVVALSPSNWKFRDELFDNEELDELLPKLREELEQLHTLHDELKGIFSLDNLPGQLELHQLKETLDAGGIFRWFKGSWRSARKQVLGHSAGKQIKFSALQPLLEKAEEFVDRRNKLGENHYYKDALGDHLKGLDTHLNTIESLRNWYKKVRLQYGIGFGQKVHLGNAILDLPIDLARGIRSLSEQGIQQHLNNLLENLLKLKEIFAPVAGLRSDRALLTGREGIIPRLLASLEKAMCTCEPLATNSAISIEELAQRIQLLDKLKKAVSKWESTDLDNKLFQGHLGLKTGVNCDNNSSLSKLRNTLVVASCIDQNLKNKEIRQQLYDQPTVVTFSSLSAISGSLRTAVEAQRAKYEAFDQLVGLKAIDWMTQTGDLIGNLITRNTLALNNGDKLQNWLDYIRVQNQVIAMGLGNLVERVEKGDIDIQQVEDAHQAGSFDMLAREIFREQPELGRFSGHAQKALQDNFKEYDNRLKKLQCEQIAWQIEQKQIPKGNFGARVSERTERFLLEHECSKKTRHLPIRRLLHKAGGALVALKPCFMMGPMSVAQYLAPGQIAFDLVVMDEASQIKPQDALGAIARGSQLVVVGDPKQLPPTSFFDRIVDNDEDDPTAIEESESILDATAPIFQARRLRWHYRSQHESLIAFSNYSFYDSDLVLFPSPYKETENYGIQYSRVPSGCFVNRRNLEEARIISEAVREHFKYRPEESLGVVAMNAEQRLQIESAVETLAKKDVAFQVLLEKDARKQDLFFIKNLENVQGDERDVIFISMTYGPQEPGGRVLQRFGPINSDMGWRRLNVLFTRSKKRMHIFSSMGSEDIVAGSTAKRGVQALRDFLSFCETKILHKTERETGRPPDSDFEIAVMAALRNKGFECVPQVGVAGFFIDAAVIDPGKPGRYLMGIECDGATYHSAKSVRDRDRLRQTILERLGWRIRRIWSTDWFKNPHAELQPIIQELNELKTERVEDYQPKTESESDDIESIIEAVEKQETIMEKYICKETGLKEKLIEFDRDVIAKALPDTPDNQRLLRPAMLEALLEFLPVSKPEFLEYMPPYLRQSTNAAEEKFLDGILEIINSNAQKEVELLK